MKRGAGFLSTLVLAACVLASADISIGKARTAVIYKRPTKALEDAQVAKAGADSYKQE